MRRLRRTSIAVLPAAIVLATPSPAAAQAATGGAEATTGPVTLVTTPRGLVGRRKLFTGSVARRDAKRTVAVQRYDELSRQWTTIARATPEPDGDFSARWKADRAGDLKVRAIVENARAQAAAAAPEIPITLFRPARATWYGPGFYGNRTACGQTMSRTLVGVAHKTLKCGTRVEFLYRGRTLVAPVVDRGPYANGASWDLTSAAAERLGFSGVDTVGALRARR
jgi:rare lipoprotein A